MNTDSIDKQLNTILKDFEQESTDAYTEQEVGIDFKALDVAYRVARNSIKQLIQKTRLDEASGYYLINPRFDEYEIVGV